MHGTPDTSIPTAAKAPQAKRVKSAKRPFKKLNVIIVVPVHLSIAGLYIILSLHWLPQKSGESMLPGCKHGSCVRRAAAGKPTAHSRKENSKGRQSLKMRKWHGNLPLHIPNQESHQKNQFQYPKCTLISLASENHKRKHKTIKKVKMPPSKYSEKTDSWEAFLLREQQV